MTSSVNTEEDGSNEIPTASSDDVVTIEDDPVPTASTPVVNNKKCTVTYEETYTYSESEMKALWQRAHKSVPEDRFISVDTSTGVVTFYKNQYYNKTMEYTVPTTGTRTVSSDISIDWETGSDTATIDGKSYKINDGTIDYNGTTITLN